MPLNLNFEEKEYDYIIVHPHHDDVKFYCKSTSVEHDLHTFSKHQGKKVIKRGVVVQEDPDAYKVGWDCFNKMLVGWDGIHNKDTGEAVPCDEKSKRWFYNRYSKGEASLCQYILDSINQELDKEAGMELGN